MSCRYCKSTSFAYRLRLYKAHRRETPIAPKWLPHIQLMCVSCDRYQKTLKQDEELRLELDGSTLMDVDFEAIVKERGNC